MGGYSDSAHGIFVLDFKGGFNSKLTYHKSWFFFDNEFVVLASDITTLNTTQPVHHVLDSRIRVGATTMANFGSTAQTSVSIGTASVYPWWLHHDSIGYVFPENYVSATTVGRKKLTYKLGAVTSSWSNTAASGSTTPITVDLFSAWLESKAPPVTGDSIAYIAAPNIAQATFAASRAQQLLSAVRIIQNTATLHAVYQSELRILGLVFWAANVTFVDAALGWDITPDQTSVVQITTSATSSVVTFGVSDPTQKLTKLSLKVKKVRKQCRGFTTGPSYTLASGTRACTNQEVPINHTSLCGRLELPLLPSPHKQEYIPVIFLTGDVLGAELHRLHGERGHYFGSVQLRRWAQL